LETALWFHDAIYDPHTADNEARSAALAVSVLRTARIAASAIAKVERLILATRAHETDANPDTTLLLDIDLAILGSSPAAYQTYAAAIRREYAWVPESEYRTKRAAILTRFLQRPRLFLTEPFFASHETRARANLAEEIQALS
jgi:predicted metal-dependent HD superfamily phosphohydrolase